MGLGATEVRVRWEKGWRGELVGDLQAPIQKLLKGAGQLRASAEKKSSLLFEATLEPQEPRVPENLLWYPYEDLWQAVADGRLNGKLRQFDLTVSSSDDDGVDSTFQAKVKRTKPLSLGGEFEAHKATTWRLKELRTPEARSVWPLASREALSTPAARAGGAVLRLTRPRCRRALHLAVLSTPTPLASVRSGGDQRATWGRRTSGTGRRASWMRTSSPE